MLPLLRRFVDRLLLPRASSQVQLNKNDDNNNFAMSRNYNIRTCLFEGMYVCEYCGESFNGFRKHRNVNPVAVVRRFRIIVRLLLLLLLLLFVSRALCTKYHNVHTRTCRKRRRKMLFGKKEEEWGRQAGRQEPPSGSFGPTTTTSTCLMRLNRNSNNFWNSTAEENAFRLPICQLFLCLACLAISRVVQLPLKLCDLIYLVWLTGLFVCQIWSVRRGGINRTSWVNCCKDPNYPDDKICLAFQFREKMNQ